MQELNILVSNYTMSIELFKVFISVVHKQPVWLFRCPSIVESSVMFPQWHSLDRAEQSKYYDMARREKELHRQMYPTWSARDNYAIHVKKKRKREFSRDDDKGTAPEDERGKEKTSQMLEGCLH